MLTPDAVLSHHTALEYHGRAYSVWQHLVYSSSRPANTLAFRTRTFRGTHFPVVLQRAGTEHYGVMDTDQKGVTIRVTSLERTLVDLLHRPRLGGGWEEIWRSLESVEYFDIDLNYVGAVDREVMLSERPRVERALTAVFGREDLAVRRRPGEHAGGKWWLRYAHPGGRGTLEVDVNYMYRVPLWPASAMD